MAPPFVQTDVIESIVKAVNEAAASFKMNDDETRTSRNTPLNMGTVYDRMTPMCIASMIAGFKVIIQPMIDLLNKQSTTMRSQDLDHKLQMDKIETFNRQDNIIVIGYEEPAQNYQTYGRESPEDMENILINIGSKVGVSIDANHISDGFRMGKRPVNSDGSPKLRQDGSKFSRPICFRLNKRFKKTELLRSKKTLKDSHGIKISEDVTPIRKALCDVANECESVKVAYPQDGKILVRLTADPSKIIRMESYKDLTKIPDFDGEYDWDKLKLADTSA